MISVNQLYKDINSFCRLLDEHHFKRSTVCLVKIFTSYLSQDNAVSVARAIRDVLPNARIVGSTAAVIIFEGRQYEDETMVLVEQYEHNVHLLFSVTETDGCLIKTIEGESAAQWWYRYLRWRTCVFGGSGKALRTTTN